MNTRIFRILDLAGSIFLVLALSGAIITGAYAEDKDKSNSQPVVQAPVKPFNPWGDGRFDKGQPVKGRENQPFNPWGDDRYDPKPNNKYVSPGLVLPGSDIKYPGSINWSSDNGRYNRSDRNNRDNQSYYKGDPNNMKYGYVPTGRDRHSSNTSQSINQSSQYGYWGFDNRDPNYCRSEYYYYGNYKYVNRSRVFIAPYPVTNYYNSSITINNNNYYLADRSKSSLDSALSDIRNAWLNGRSDLIANHVSNDQIIAVLLDGSYDYSLEASDYSQMTYDAIGGIKTLGFTWGNVKQRTNGDYTAFGQHIYLDSNGNEQTVYVSYTLRMIGNDYAIVEVGSSKQPLG